MASDESMTVRSCVSTQEDDFDHDDDILEGGDYYQPHPHHPHKYFSRLSVCNTTSIDDQQGPNPNCVYDFAADHLQDPTDSGMYHMMSGLSIESFDADDEDDLSDGLKPTKKGLHHDHMGLDITSDSDEESRGGCYSLPATPPRMRGRNQQRKGDHGKECVSENEGSADRLRRRRWRRRRMITRERLMRDGVSWNKFREEESTGMMMMNMNMMEMDDRSHESRSPRVLGGDDEDDDEPSNNNNYNKCSSTGGDSQSEPSSATVVMITRPKGGKRSLRMDLEEVKACRELGFELETPFRLPLLLHTVSNLSADTSTTSGGNSPVHWRISSPGDDPRDVKARLKVWAQAVAIASTSRQAN